MMPPIDADWMANSVDPDQTAPLGAVWSGSTLFAQAYLSENLGSLRHMYIFKVHVHPCWNFTSVDRDWYPAQITACE